MVEYLKSITDLTKYIGTAPFNAVRVNPLKLTKSQFEQKIDFDVTECEFFEYGYRVKEEVSGNHPLHMAGGFYIQEPSAMSAITALQPQKDDIILDACAAPGSKATAIAPMCKMLVANEINKTRATTLIGNIERMGISNTLILNSDTEAVGNAFEGYFDKVLVDSPCSGEGMFRKHPSILNEWNHDLVKMCAERSAQVLRNASKALKSGGRLVYSTCTYNLEENEKLINAFLQENPDFELCDTGLEFGTEGLLGLDKARRIFIEHGGEGHFVCAMTRTGDVFSRKVKPFKLKYNFDFLEGITVTPPRFYGNDVRYGTMEFSGVKYALPEDMPNPSGVRIMRAGVKLGEQVSKVFKPDHHLFMSVQPDSFINKIEVDYVKLKRFTHGDIFECDSSVKGFCAIMYDGLCIGFGKASRGVCKNHFPSGLRI